MLQSGGKRCQWREQSSDRCRTVRPTECDTATQLLAKTMNESLVRSIAGLNAGLLF